MVSTLAVSNYNFDAPAFETTVTSSHACLKRLQLRQAPGLDTHPRIST